MKGADSYSSADVSGTFFTITLSMRGPSMSTTSKVNSPHLTHSPMVGIRSMVLYILEGEWNELIADFVQWNFEYDMCVKMKFFGDEAIEEIDRQGKNYQTSVYYMDLVGELEKMGDFMINVSQDLEKAYK